MKTVERKTVGIATLIPASYNPRKIDAAAAEALKTSIERFGLVQEIVVNGRNNRVVGGHQRLSVLRQLGQREVAIAIVDLTDDEERALNVVLNSPKVQGDFTDDLQSLLSSINGDVAAGLRFDDLVADFSAIEALVDSVEAEKFKLDALPIQQPPSTIWVLCAIPVEKWPALASLFDQVAKTEGVAYDQVVR